MSLLDAQIKKIVKDKLVYQENESTVSAEIKFTENFIGFHGHFPNNPVLPGVVMIKVVIKIYELYKGKEYVLSVIKKAKFAEPVFAGDIILFSVKADEGEDGIKLMGKVIKSEKNIAKISLVLQNTPV